MNTENSSRSIWKSIGLVGAVVVSAALLMPATLAHNGHGGKNHRQKHYKKHHQTRYDRHDSHHARHDHRAYHSDVRFDRWARPPHARLSFTIPVRIHRRDFNDFRPYFRGDFYFAPHRHRHALYTFPVYGEVGTRYVDRYYCEGELYRHPPHRPRVSFSVRF